MIARFYPKLIAPCDDASLLVLSQIVHPEANCLNPVGEACNFAFDKWSQIDAARASGFAVMETRLIERETDIDRFPIRPALIKPRAALDIRGNVIGKGRAFVINGDRIPRKAQLEVSRRPYLIQEYKAGVGEGIFGIAHEGKVYGCFGHRRVRMMNPAGSGASACIWRKPECTEVRAAEALVELTAWRGPFMVELLRDPSGKAWFMEFNGRFWGSLALARICGLDIPGMSFDLACGVTPQKPSHVEHGFARHLGRDLIHLLMVMRGPDPEGRTYTWPGRLSTLRDIMSFHRLSSFYNYNSSEPFFFIKDAAITVTNALLGRNS